MKWVYDDGGRKEAGYKGDTRDCATRAVAIAAGRPYQLVYKAIDLACRDERHLRWHQRRMITPCHPRTGVCKEVLRKFLLDAGWVWTPLMGIGTGCRVHLADGELPTGRLIVQVSSHWAAVIDGVLHDTYESSYSRWSGPDKRCVYGYWEPGALIAYPDKDCQACKTGRGRHTCGLSGLQDMLRIGS